MHGPLPGGLYRPEFEHASCGFGLIAHMDGHASHWLVRTAIQGLGRLTHRGAVAADGKTGDGCGLLLKRPDAWLRVLATEAGIEPAPVFALGMVFLSQGPALARKARRRLAAELVAEGLAVAGWRIVPVDPGACGEQALRSLPRIEQIYVNAPPHMGEDPLERHLYLARRRAEKALEPGDPDFYVASLSSRVLAFKGLVLPANLPVFYRDLQDPRLSAALCVFHQRFSTNTWPQWRLAQPFRYLAHNGEINTIHGNRNWAEARARKLDSPLLPRARDACPLLSERGSDSCSLDNMLEFLLAGGMDIFRAMRLLIPPAWQNEEAMDPDLRACYEYHSMHMEPWDGPAGVVLTDGRHAACLMDRNGLRPARYVITRCPPEAGPPPAAQGYAGCVITLASEVGVHDYAPQEVVAKGRLKPGEMIAADTLSGTLLQAADVDRRLQGRHPYRAWLTAHARRLESRLERDESCPELEAAPLAVYEKLYGMSFEERDQVLRVLSEMGQEAVGSMGDDTPLPALSRQVRPLYDSFRQQFAQVTNPPIDPLREQIVMSLETCFGRERNLFEETEDHARRLAADSPVLSTSQLRQLLMEPDPDYAQARIALCYRPELGLRSAILAVTDAAVAAVRAGKTVLLLSDRAIDPQTLPIHALLATGAVHHRLIREGLRCDANLVVETATARDPHHYACLIGCGATAVYPYLAYACLCDMAQGDAPQRLQRYRRGIDKGLLKILSKMGISTLASYRGAQLFEIVGLRRQVVDLCFTGIPSRIEGMGFEHLQADQALLAREAWIARRPRRQGGLLKFIHGGEYHAYNPAVVQALHRAVESGDYGKYLEYASLVSQRPVTVLRDLLALRTDLAPAPLEEVEPVEAILPSFDTAAMSLGALSPEAHETLARAMNRLGGRSNSGEGGEDPARFGTERRSKIKQVASGRFGVTPQYLADADVLQIKIAQGAKPGEGGQLPGHKVNAMIARLRYASPGVALISPPPHHDIYSIEDLAQLIFDLKQVNPRALVSVKLVSAPGVGTIAAGVAKAYSDLITIAGYDGGTGASPLTSVKYAGLPWELGLAETHLALRANDLRDKVRLQTDGGLKTGLDIVKAAVLGAESFGFGTAPMIAMGCKYLRLCHLNNCATGVATQDERLRRLHFKPDGVEKVVRYFRFVAQEVREWLARLGVRRLQDLIGRADLLSRLPGETERQRRLDLGPILEAAGWQADKPQHCTHSRNEPFGRAELAERMVRDALPAIEARCGARLEYAVRNDNRSIGARLSGEIARRWGNSGMEQAPIRIHLRGTTGQSFGTWNAGGLHLILEGDANDYVGKGMAGGKLVLRPPPGVSYAGRQSVIMGNTCLYGATGGRLYAAGLAGERFAVRNSGARAAVEGVGDHCCEYMTGGMVCVLGPTGLNFGAGMTGGLAFVLDREDAFAERYNRELVETHRVHVAAMEAYLNCLRELIEEMVTETDSPSSRSVLSDLPALAHKFWLVKPRAVDLETLLSTLRRAA